MKIVFAALTVAIGLVQGTCTYAQLSGDTAARIDALFAGHPQDEPGGVLMITRHGQKIYRKVFGVTNLEQPTPITGETIFVAASVSKQFTAASMLMLVREGKISLDDDARKYVPELPDYGTKITIRHLLTHTSGLKDWRNVTYLTSWPTGYRVFTQEYAFRYICGQTNLNYAPGERYSYTNAGYDLSAIIIERISGKPFPDFVQERLLEPAGMTHSTFRSKVTDVIKGMASGYYMSGNNYVHTQILDETYGAAGLLTTAEDLEKWNKFIHNSRIGKDIAAIREDRYVLNNGDTITYANGGVNVSLVNGVKEITHSGLLGGFRALCTYYPEKGLSVTYMSNNKDISTVELRKDVAEIFFGKDPRYNQAEEISPKFAKTGKTGKAIAAQPLKGKTGVFLNVADESDFLKLHEYNGHLMSYSAVLEPVAQDVFVYEKNIYRFQPGGDTAWLHRAGEDFTYARVAAFVPSASELAAFTGAFHSNDAGVTLEFRISGNRLIAYRAEGDSVILSPVFRVNNRYAFRGFDHGLRATYLFQKDKGEAVKRLDISLPRAAGIPFYKK